MIFLCQPNSFSACAKKFLESFFYFSVSNNYKKHDSAFDRWFENCVTRMLCKSEKKKTIQNSRWWNYIENELKSKIFFSFITFNPMCLVLKNGALFCYYRCSCFSQILIQSNHKLSLIFFNSLQLSENTINHFFFLSTEHSPE